MGELLTDRQRAILEYIREAITSVGRAPTIREIGAQFGITSTNGVRDHITALIRKGYVVKDEVVSRGIRLAEQIGVEVARLPIVGRAPAGALLTAVENFEGEIAVDTSFVPSGDCYSLRIVGDSMINAGIHDGDYVIVRKQDKAEAGEIVVAVVEDEATVKRLFFDAGPYTGTFTRGMLRLQPENNKYQPIIVNPRRDNVYIAGKVTGLIRKYR